MDLVIYRNVCMLVCVYIICGPLFFLFPNLVIGDAGTVLLFFWPGYVWQFNTLVDQNMKYIFFLGHITEYIVSYKTLIAMVWQRLSVQKL